METKILFADIDGTLLNDQKEIPKENMTAIQKALDLGHYVVVATGRPLDSAKAVAKDLGLMMQGCYLIAYNGAIVYDCGNEKVLKKESLPLAYVKELFERGKKSRALHSDLQRKSDHYNAGFPGVRSIPQSYKAFLSGGRGCI